MSNTEMNADLASVVLEGVPSLFSAARAGDTHGATVALRRFLGRLRRVDPTLAEQLKLRLGTPTAEHLRSAAASLTIAPQDRDSAMALLQHVPTADILRPVLAPEAVRVLSSFLLEHRNLEALAQEGLRPRHTMLLVGPPGVGKTMASAWIAAELGLPLFQIELSGLISSYLGKTGQNLRGIFDFARSNSIVLLMDEFDAVAKRRDDPLELGEVRRIVSVLLKEVEEWPGPSVILAATNFEESVDPAVIRRFQAVLHIALPGVKEAVAVLKLHMEPHTPSMPVLRLAGELLAGQSGSDIRNVAIESRRTLVLHPNSTIDQALLRILASRADTMAKRRAFALAARSLSKKPSYSDLAELLGVSKATAHSYCKGNDD